MAITSGFIKKNPLTRGEWEKTKKIKKQVSWIGQFDLALIHAMIDKFLLT